MVNSLKIHKLITHHSSLITQHWPMQQPVQGPGFHLLDINSIFIRYKLDINSIQLIEEIALIFRLFFVKI